jgi:hypothetical protein
MGWFEQAPANKVSRDHRENGCLPSECRGWGKTSTLARAGQSSACHWGIVAAPARRRDHPAAAMLLNIFAPRRASTLEKKGMIAKYEILANATINIEPVQ